MPALVGDWGFSPESIELLDKDPCRRIIDAGGGRKTPARFSDSGLSPNSSDDEWLSPRLFLPAAPATAAAAVPPREFPCLEGESPEWPSSADIRAMRPPGNTS